MTDQPPQQQQSEETIAQKLKRLEELENQIKTNGMTNKEERTMILQSVRELKADVEEMKAILKRTDDEEEEDDEKEDFWG